MFVGRPIGLVAIAVWWLAGCAHYRDVRQPPAYDLLRYSAVGLLEVDAPGRPQLASQASQQFLQHLTQAQPGVRVLSLGPQAAALSNVGAATLNAEAIRTLGQRAGVQVLFAGTLGVTEVTPSINVGAMLREGSISAKVSSSLSLSLYDVGTGAVLWTQARTDADSAGGVGVSGRGGVGLDIDSPDNAYLRMVQRLTDALAEPFRAHMVRERVD